MLKLLVAAPPVSRSSYCLIFIRAAHQQRFKDKVAVITASTEGIGFAAAKRLGEEGAAVVVSSRRQENVDRALLELRRAGVRVEGMPCHVSNAEQRRELFQLAKSKFGGIDILISNAGVNPAKSHTIEMEDQIWDKIFEVNLKNSWQLAKEVYPELMKRKGNIIFMSTGLAYQPKVLGYQGVYATAKSGLLSLTKALANELSSTGVRVNSIAPGAIRDTKFGAVLTQSKAMRDKTLSMVSMRREGLPSEVAGAIAFLASDDASYVTGTTLLVTGGVPAGL